MATVAQGKPKNGFQVWQDYVNQAPSRPEQWNVYDCDIQIAVHEYNRHLANVAGYRSLDWHFIKAMTWVETGAGVPEWKSSPIQIGNPGDPGLTALLSGNEGGDLILPPTLARKLNAGTAARIPSTTFGLASAMSSCD